MGMGPHCPAAVGSNEKYCNQNGICTIEKREEVGVLAHHVPPTVPFLTPYTGISHGQHGWQVQTSQILKHAAILTSKDQAASVIIAAG